jgi:hypothetical protein
MRDAQYDDPEAINNQRQIQCSAAVKSTGHWAAFADDRLVQIAFCALTSVIIFEPKFAQIFTEFVVQLCRKTAL